MSVQVTLTFDNAAAAAAALSILQGGATVAPAPAPQPNPTPAPAAATPAPAPAVAPLTVDEINAANAKLGQIAMQLGSGDPIVAILQSKGLSALSQVGENRALLESIVAESEKLLTQQAAA